MSSFRFLLKSMHRRLSFFLMLLILWWEEHRREGHGLWGWGLPRHREKGVKWAEGSARRQQNPDTRLPRQVASVTPETSGLCPVCCMSLVKGLLHPISFKVHSLGFWTF